MTKRYLAKALLVIGALWATAALAAANLDSVDLKAKVPGTLVQAVETIDPTKDKMSVRLNPSLAGYDVNLPGWNSKDLKASNEAELLKAFGVRTLSSGNAAQAGGPIFYVGKGVGRSGILEKTKVGDSFMVVQGRPLKGLTIKGYGGNTINGNSHQPGGSLEATEAYRDSLISSILTEKGIDAYVGALFVERANNQANFIRLSRTTLRMNDLIDRKGPELRATVDHLTELLEEEVGKRMTADEFYDWLVAKTARAIAGKEYIGFKHGSQTDSNIGIGEMVDFGEGVYDPLSYSSSTSASQKASFQSVLQSAASNLATEYKLNKNFNLIFDSNYDTEFQARTQQDKERVVLDEATEADLKKLGLSDALVQRIVKARETLDFGLISPADALKSGPVSLTELKVLQDRTTTQFMKMANGQPLPRAILSEIGYEDGLRSALDEAVQKLGGASGIGKIPAATIETTVKQVVEARIDQLSNGLSGKAHSYYGAFPAKHITTRITALIQTRGDAVSGQARSAKAASASCGAAFN